MPLINLCYCNNKKLHRNSIERPVEYKWSLHQQRVASSENETSESPRDNFSTSKPVDMFDSNLSQLRGVDGIHLYPPPFELVLRTKWPITTKSHFPLKNSADHGSCPEEFGSPLCPSMKIRILKCSARSRHDYDNKSSFYRLLSRRQNLPQSSLNKLQ